MNVSIKTFGIFLQKQQPYHNGTLILICVLTPPHVKGFTSYICQKTFCWLSQFYRKNNERPV